MGINKEKVLLLEIKQPFAHYREPKVMQDNYIPTLNLPPATTIAGMISYLIERQLKTVYKIGVVGTYKGKTVEFIRGEQDSFFGSYEKLVNDNLKMGKSLDLSEFYNYHKKEPKNGKEKIGNRIMYFEVLQNVSLKIFISTENNKLVKEALEKPSRYLNLGRKEDFIMPEAKCNSYVKEVEIENINIKDKKQAIKNNLVFKNTYVPVDIKKEETKNLVQEGVLYSLPKKYKDLNAEKKDRVIEYGHYIYLDNNGAHLAGIDANVYQCKQDNGDIENVMFAWM